MRLALNNEFLDLRKSTKEALFVKETVKMFLDEYASNNTILLKWDDSWVKQATVISDAGDRMKMPEYPTRKNMSAFVNYQSSHPDMNNVMEFWLYENEKIHSLDYIERKPRKIRFTSNITLNGFQTEEIFWYVFVSPYCGPLPGELGKRQNRNKRNPYYQVYNSAKSATEALLSMKKKSEIEYRLTTDDKMMAIDDDLVRELASAFFITDIPGKSIEELRLGIIQRIKTDNDYAQFKFLTENTDSLEVYKIVQLAKDTKAIAIKENKNNSAWHFWNSDEQTFGNRIVLIRQTEDSNKALVRHLQLDKNSFAQLKDAVQTSVE